MFESIVSKTNIICTTLRALGAATQKTQWFLPAAIVALFLVL